MQTTTLMRFLTLGMIFTLLVSCQKEASKPIVIIPDHFHNAVDKVTEIMIHDIFSPPVASRIYAYPNVAAYEVLASQSQEFKSLAGQLNGLSAIPKPEAPEAINYDLAALIAHMDVSKRLIFSEDRMEAFQDSLYNVWSTTNEQQLVASKAYGLTVAQHVADWLDKDNYKQTRTMPKFTVETDDPSRWQPTPPSYMDGIEPHWSKIRPFVLDSSAQFKPAPPPPFSLDKESVFYKELEEVYTLCQKITEEGDTSEEIEIAQFWDCNPYVSVTRGHLMFATKKITPGAHWIGITKIASKKADYDVINTMNAYTKTSIAIADAFISCWDEKYRSNLIRPETLINEHMDDNWQPILQTPPFPEYVSGHSVVSGAASEVLTDIFGDNFSFNDTTEVPYGLPIRNFKSFRLAAQEAAVSRLYGGIHYRAAVDIGLDQGRLLGQFVSSKIETKK